MNPKPPSGERSVGVAVVGLGYWGPNLVRNFHDVCLADVRLICDPRAEQLEAVGRRYPAVRRTAHFDDVLSDDSIDAIAIATPVGTHFDLAERALEAGKHVFVEKPLAGSVAEAEKLLLLARSRGLVLMPGHTFLYSPPVNVVRDFIQSGELGDVYFVSTSRVNLGLHQPDVSVAWDLGPHDFSILRYWLEETPSWISALSRGCIFPSMPDVAFINMEFPSSTIAHVELSWLAPSSSGEPLVVGSQKMIVYDDTSTEPVRVFDSGVMPKDPETFGEYKMTYRTGDIVSPRIDALEPLNVELTDFCSAIVHGTPLRSSAEVGVDVVRMIEAVEASLAERGARIDVSQPLRI